MTELLEMVVHVCNHSTGEAEVGGSRVQGPPELHRDPSQTKRVDF
jgi:hypothetical protein